MTIHRNDNPLPDNLEDIEVPELAVPQRQMTTDLVRLYLQDIGRVPLLKKDEEIQKAQELQRYLQLVELRNQAADNDEPLMRCFVNIIDNHEQLSSQLGHSPSIERWANSVDLTVFELKKAINQGRYRWAQLAGIEVAELEQIEKKGLQAKQQMIQANLRLVVSVAKRYQHRGLELLDLIQEGSLGLERAVEKFDPTKGYRFSTYAYWWIRQGITRAIATQSRMIRLPIHVTEKLNKIKKVQRKIAQDQGKVASINDLSRELDMTPAQIREVLSRVPRSVSLEIKVGKEKDTELVDLLETTETSPEESLVNEALRQDLQLLLDELTNRERDVIELRYGFTDGRCYSLADIGRLLRLSRERVRQIEAKAIQKLRQPKRRNQIRDYFDTLG